MSAFFQELLIFIYCMPPFMVIIGILAASSIFLKLCRRYGNRCWFGVLAGLFLFLWGAMVIWLTTLGRSTPAPEPPVWIPLYSYWEAFFHGKRELISSNLMNIALFYPGGLLAASLFPKDCPSRRQRILILIFGATLSLYIELFQLHLILGKPEFDDVLHNAIGALLGSCYHSYSAKRHGR